MGEWSGFGCAASGHGPNEPGWMNGSRDFWQGVSLAITNLIKLCGLIAAMNELLIEPSADPRNLAFIAVMLAGTQGIENFLKGVFGSK